VGEAGRILKARGADYSTIDGIRINFPAGWGLVRASNTQPVLVMRFEAETEEQLAEYEHYVRDVIREAGGGCNVQYQ